MEKSLAINQGTNYSLPSTVSAALNTAQIFPSLAAPLAAVVVTAEASGQLEQREFGITASGILTTLGNYTALIGLYAKVVLPAAPLTAANWTLIGASSARAINTTTAPFLFRASLISDSVSGLLHGTFNCIINNIFDASAAITALTGVNLAGSTEPGINFALAVTFGTAAANVGKLTNFYLSA